MISVLTLTYQRHQILEEAIQSFLLQNVSVPTEMVVINDSPHVHYVIDEPRVRILNCPTRFSSINKKIEWGYKQCTYDWIYRLDDDDLLAPKGLKIITNDIIQNPGYDIYRGSGMYLFTHNRFTSEQSNVNNGNVYSRSYLNRVNFLDMSWGEDVNITFGYGGRVFHSNEKIMIYRWGMSTYHISGFGQLPTEQILEKTDQICGIKENGLIRLNPHFKEDYYSQLPLNAQDITPIIEPSGCPVCNGNGKIKRTSVLKIQKTGFDNVVEEIEERYIDCSLCKNKKEG